MRRTLGFLSLLVMMAIAAGCGGSDTNANSPGTTTYNSSAPATTGGGAPVGAAPSSNSNANRPNEPGIKPPTDK